MSSPRIDELEVKLSFQEDLLDQLNAQVSSQELRLIELERRILALSQALKNLDRGQSNDPNAQELPPHY